MSAVKFVQITGSPIKVDGGKGGLYALDTEGRVFYYADKDGDEGWIQLTFDDKRALIEDDAKRP